MLAIYGQGWQTLLLSRADMLTGQRLWARFGAGLNSNLLIMPEPGFPGLLQNNLVFSAYDRDQAAPIGAILGTRTQGALIFNLHKGAQRLSDRPGKRYYWM